MIDLRDASSVDLAYRSMNGARRGQYRNMRDAMFFARHSRSTSIEVIERMPLSKFRSYLRRLNEILEVEWEAPEL